VTLNHIDPMCSLPLSSIHIGMYALILYLGLILRIWVGMMGTVGFRQVMWFVMLESANDRILEVDP
jgi:hypothetical protein